jgi:uncharacterized protein YbjT (DUF2867 family)
MDAHVFVIGATGTVGREIIKLLRERGVAVRATTRDVDGAPRLGGVQWVRLTKPGDAGPRILAGAAGLFLMAPSGYVDQHAILSPWIRAASRANVARVVLMTAQEVNDSDQSPFRRAELELIESGINHSIIRPNWFMQNFHNYWGDEVRRCGTIELPAGNGKIAFIDARDIAAVAVAQLLAEKVACGTLVLTGPEALDHTQAARILSNATGRQISYRDADPVEFGKTTSAVNGMPEDYVRSLLDMFTAVRAGAAAGVTSHVERLTGRPARSLADYARDYRELLT